MYVGDKESSSRTAYSNGKLIYKSYLMMLPTALQCICQKESTIDSFFLHIFNFSFHNHFYLYFENPHMDSKIFWKYFKNRLIGDNSFRDTIF